MTGAVLLHHSRTMQNSNKSGYLATAEAYDPGSNTWATLPALPTARGFLAAATTADRRIVAIGGYDDTALATVEAYSPGTNTWSTLAPLPAPRGLLAAVTGADGRLYAIGGVDLSSASGDRYVARYDPSANIWSESDLGTVVWNFGAAPGPNGAIYMLGGNPSCCTTP